MASTTTEITSESPSVYYQNVLMDKPDDPEHIYLDLHHNKPRETENVSGKLSAPNKQSSSEKSRRLGLIIWSVFSAVTIIGLLSGCIYLGTTVTRLEEKDNQSRPDVHECSSNPCQNGGTCYIGMNIYVCVCEEGWKGTHCTEEVNECRSNPCQNGATCQDGFNAYTCNCSEGWHGEICSLDVDECSNNPCHNGATCRDGVNDYSCLCMMGWKGAQCSEDVDECSSNPCQNGATCLDGINEYSCSCMTGWKGAQCSEGEHYWTSGRRDSSEDIRVFHWINNKRIPLNGDTSLDLWFPGEPNNHENQNENAVEIIKDNRQVALNDVMELDNNHILCQRSS